MRTVCTLQVDDVRVVIYGHTCILARGCTAAEVACFCKQFSKVAVRHLSEVAGDWPREFPT